MTTYADVKKQIAQLEKKAADLRKVEVAKAVANIREQMVKYELTVDDIAPGKSSGKGKPAARSAKVKVGKPAKYMDPKTGKTWTGHGKAPSWIAAATKAGRRDDFLIGGVTQTKMAKPAEKSKPTKPVAAKKATTVPKKVAAKKVATKKPMAPSNKAPVAKKASTANQKPAPAKPKSIIKAKKLATKPPAKSSAKAKVRSKPVAKPASGAKSVKKSPTASAESTPVVSA